MICISRMKYLISLQLVCITTTFLSPLQHHRLTLRSKYSGKMCNRRRVLDVNRVHMKRFILVVVAAHFKVKFKQFQRINRIVTIFSALEHMDMEKESNRRVKVSLC